MRYVSRLIGLLMITSCATLTPQQRAMKEPHLSPLDSKKIGYLCASLPTAPVVFCRCFEIALIDEGLTVDELQNPKYEALVTRLVAECKEGLKPLELPEPMSF
jgi:hypothetical protein